MNNILKFFPFMPGKNETGKLILAYALYNIALPLVVSLVNILLSLTIILSPVALVLAFVANAYALFGVVFAVLHYVGYDFSTMNNP